LLTRPANIRLGGIAPRRLALPINFALGPVYQVQATVHMRSPATNFSLALFPGLDCGLDCLEFSESRFEVIPGNFPCERLEKLGMSSSLEIGE
jgi:hypothetical protein